MAITGIGGIAVFGWLAEMSRRVALQEEEILPEWDQIGDFFLNGLKFMGVTLIWTSPVILLTIIFSLVPAGILIGMSGDPGNGNCDHLDLIRLLLGLLHDLHHRRQPADSPFVGAGGRGMPFKELLNPKMAWGVFRANAGGFIVAFLISSLAGSLLSMAGVMLCVVGMFLTMVAAQLIFAHLIGQATTQAGNAESANK